MSGIVRMFIVAATYDGFVAFGAKLKAYRRDNYDSVFVCYPGKLPEMDSDGYSTVLAPCWRQHPRADVIEALILERNLQPAATELRNAKATA